MKQLRRSTAALLAALALAAGSASACGFNYATDRDYERHGGDAKDGTVKVLNAVIVTDADNVTVSEEPVQGTLVATLNNTDSGQPDAITSVEPGAGAEVEVSSFDPIEIPARGTVNLANAETGVNVTGAFSTGNYIQLVIGFESGQSATVDVPVVPDTGSYEGLFVPSAPETTGGPAEGPTPPKDNQDNNDG